MTLMSKHKPAVVDFTTVSPQTTCRLLSLPPELKNNIYEMVLQDFHMELLLPNGNDEKPLCKAPGLLLTCKEIHQDTIKMFYTTVTIVVPLDEPTPVLFENSNYAGRRRLDTYLRTIGRDKRALLSSMIETPTIQALHPDFSRLSSDDGVDPYLSSFRDTVTQKSDLIEYAKHALGRPLLECWFKEGADGKPQYSTNPVREFKSWSDAKEHGFQRVYDLLRVLHVEVSISCYLNRVNFEINKKAQDLKRGNVFLGGVDAAEK